MQRKIIQSLKKWKHKTNRKPLIIQGARQVGKTWAMKHFGEQSFEKVAYINFDNNPRMKTLFSGDYDIDRLILGLKIESGVDIQAENTLIIFDEVQEVPQALSSLKYFYENAPQFYEEEWRIGQAGLVAVRLFTPLRPGRAISSP